MFKIINNGKLPYYSNAKLEDLLEEASPDLHKLKNKFLKLDKKTFYELKPNIYIFGGHRRGKTWMLHALINYIIENFKEKSVYYVTMPQLVEFMKDNFNPHFTLLDENILSIYLNCNILFIDDFGTEYKSVTGWSAIKVEEFLKYRFSHNKITILAGNLQLENIEAVYGESLANFIDGEYITYEIYPDSKDLSKIVLSRKWKK